MRGFLVKPNFFAVIMNPNTRAGAAGVIKTQKSVQKKKRTKPANTRTCGRLHVGYMWKHARVP